MKKLAILSIFIFPSLLFAQYSEAFNTAGKGVEGSCSGSALSSCTTYDVSGIVWSISGDASGFGTGDMFITTSGVLRAEDIDAEFCWISPTLDIDVGGNVSISADVTWNAYDDPSDYIDLEYSIDGGGFTQVANIQSGLTSDHTVDGGVVSGGNGAGSTTLSISGLSGNTLDLRVCFDHNSISEASTLDNISVPEVGVTLFGLPVEWGDIDITNKNGSVALYWTTLSESNNNHFEILRSEDNLNWYVIGKRAGAGFSQAPISYSFIDEKPIQGLSQYRIRQVDFNGKGSMSKIMEVEVLPKEFLICKVFPNPANEQVLISTQSPEPGMLSLQILDLQGKRVLQSEAFLQAGKQETPIGISSLPDGMYYLKSSLNRWQAGIFLIKKSSPE